MSGGVILAIDQGTTSSRAIVFDAEGRPLGAAGREFTQRYPKPGWVEHDPDEIMRATLDAVVAALAAARARPSDAAAIGITNQRETTVVWERSTGRPVSNAVVWQCRRTAPICEKLKKAGLEKTFRRKTGLVIDAYFSGTKVKWILDNVPGARRRAAKGELLFGTIDSWLLWNLTGGAVHAIEISNASRTLLFNIRTLRWDDDILDALGVPASILPRVCASSEIVGKTKGLKELPDGIPVAGIAGDQQAALFGQACFAGGDSKCTYGTGAFLLMNTGARPVPSKSGLLTTIAWKLNGRTVYALEGSVFISGAVVQWLRDELGFFGNASESEALAGSVADTGGVYIVPAFVGLGAPHWDMYARGTITGITRGTGRAHITRAALEAMAYQTRDLVDAMEADSGLKLKTLNADGGAVANNFLMQFQADVLGVPVVRPRVSETTALGAAFLAGLAVGFWTSPDALRRVRRTDRVFKPAMKPAVRKKLYEGWRTAVERSMGQAR
ncbi:MAG: glycerol kinase GlpK [bacterium]